MLKIDTEKCTEVQFGGSVIEISAEWLAITESMFEKMNEVDSKRAEKFAEIIEEHVHRCFLTGKEKEEFEKECKDAIKKVDKLAELDDLLGKILELIED